MSSDNPIDPMCSEPPDSLTNADMDGIAVAAANVVANLCLRITVTWSPGDVDVGIQSLLFQFYPILLSTLLSVNRKQLSTIDASFALLLSLSPLTVYLVFASICDLFRIRTGLYKRIKSYRLIIRILGVSIPLLWTGLSMTIGISTRAFQDSSCYGGLTFGMWLKSTIMSLAISFTEPGIRFFFAPGFILVFLTPWFVCLVRRWSQLRADVKLYSEGASRLRVLWTWAKCAWCTIDRNHKWCIYYLFAFLDASWAFQVLYSAVVMTGYGYVLSYGQLLSALFVVPTLISTAKFIYSCRLDLLHLLRRLPRLCLAEAWYLLTGKELPSSYPDRPTLGGPRDQIVTGVRSTHQPLLFSELDCAMWSGWE